MGNLQLLKDDGGEAFNKYAYFMTHNPLIKTVAYANYFFFLYHAFRGISLALANRSARPVAYTVKADGANSGWSSRNMALLGTVLLVFIVIHLSNFWYKMKFGSMPEITYAGDPMPYKDLYVSVSLAFKELWIVILYVVAQIALGYHLFHGFQSSFQSLGLKVSKYASIIDGLGKVVFGVLIPAGFALLPIYIYFK